MIGVLSVLQRGKEGAITSSLSDQTVKLLPTPFHALCIAILQLFKTFSAVQNL